MAPTFNITDPATWAPELTLDQVAEIRQMKPVTVRHGCKPSAKRPFVPQPFQKRPLRWRKADVVRFYHLARTA